MKSYLSGIEKEIFEMRFSKFIYTALLILSFFTSPSFSQQLKVENVSFESVGNIVKIKYDLSGNYNKKYKISIRLSNDNGISYNIHPKTTTGDLGKNITPGKNKQIEWHIYKDFPKGLAGDKFVFAVDAELQKGRKWPFYLLGTGVAAGAAVLYLSQQAKEEDPTTGSIIIDIPN